jgi:hypothetical protein
VAASACECCNDPPSRVPVAVRKCASEINLGAPADDSINEGEGLIERPWIKSSDE